MGLLREMSLWWEVHEHLLTVSPPPLGPAYPLLSAIPPAWFETGQMFSGLRAPGIFIAADILVCCGIR